MNRISLERILSAPLGVDRRNGVRVETDKFFVASVSRGMNDRDDYAQLFAVAPELLKLAMAVAEAFPPTASRDRFGRINGRRSHERIRELALAYQVGPCAYTDEQIGKVALAILGKLGIEIGGGS